MTICSPSVRPDRRIIMGPPTLLTDWHHCGPICSSSFFFSSQGPSSGNRHYHHHHCPPSPLSHPRRRLRMPQNHSRPVFVFVVGRPSDCLLVIRSRDGGSGQKGKLGGGGEALRAHNQEMNVGDIQRWSQPTYRRPTHPFRIPIRHLTFVHTDYLHRKRGPPL